MGPQNTSSSDLRDKRYSNHRDHSRPRVRDCSIDKHTRDPNKRGSSSEQNMFRDFNRSREPSRGSSRDSLDQTYEDNNHRSKPTLQRQGTFTELRKSRPQSGEFSQSPSPRPGRPLSGPPLVATQSQDSDVNVGGARRKAASFSRQVSESSGGRPPRLQVNPAVQERQEQVKVTVNRNCKKKKVSQYSSLQARPTHSGCFS